MEEESRTRAVKNSLQGIPIINCQETVNSLGLPKQDWKTYKEHDGLGDLGKLTMGWWSNNWQDPASSSPEVRAQEEAEN